MKRRFILQTMAIFLGVLLVLLLISIGANIIPTEKSHVAGNTYYVAKGGNDNNPGTFDSPWLTIQHAASTMVAGDTVDIETGTFNKIITVPNSGLSRAPVTF